MKHIISLLLFLSIGFQCFSQNLQSVCERVQEILSNPTEERVIEGKNLLLAEQAKITCSSAEYQVCNYMLLAIYPLLGEYENLKSVSDELHDYLRNGGEDSIKMFFDNKVEAYRLLSWSLMEYYGHIGNSKLVEKYGRECLNFCKNDKKGQIATVQRLSQLQYQLKKNNQAYKNIKACYKLSKETNEISPQEHAVVVSTYLHILQDLVKESVTANRIAKAKQYVKEIRVLINTENKDATPMVILDNQFVISIVELFPQKSNQKQLYEFLEELQEFRYQVLHQNSASEKEDFGLSKPETIVNSYLNLCQEAIDSNRISAASKILREFVPKFLENNIVGIESQYYLKCYNSIMYQIEEDYVSSLEVCKQIIESPEFDTVINIYDVLDRALSALQESTTCVRYFFSEQLGQRGSKDIPYVPIVNSSDVQKIIDLWKEIYSLTANKFGKSAILAAIYKYRCPSDDIFDRFSPADIQLMECYNYLRIEDYNYAFYLLRNLIIANSLRDEDIGLIFYQISTEMNVHTGYLASEHLLRYVKAQEDFMSKPKVAWYVTQLSERIKIWVSNEIGVAKGYIEEGEFEKGLNYYEHIVRDVIPFMENRDSLYMETQQNRAYDLLALEKYEDALRVFNQVDSAYVACKATNYLVKGNNLSGKGGCYFHMKQYSEALLAVDECIKIWMNHQEADNDGFHILDALRQRCQILIEQGDYESAKIAITEFFNAHEKYNVPQDIINLLYGAYISPLNNIDFVKRILELIDDEEAESFCKRVAQIDSLLRLKDIEVIVKWVREVGLACYHTRHYPLAVLYCKQAVDLAIEHKELFDDNFIHGLYSDLSMAYEMTSSWVESLDALSAGFYYRLEVLGLNDENVKNDFRYVEAHVGNLLYLSPRRDYSYLVPQNYEEYILIIKWWRNFIKSVESKCGTEGLHKLKQHVLSFNNNELIDDADSKSFLFTWDEDKLTYLSKSYYDECGINLKFNRLAEFKISYRALCGGLELDNPADDIDLIRYKIAGSLSSQLETLGYYDWAGDLWSQLWDYFYEHDKQYCEKIVNKVCYLAWRRNDFARLWELISVDRYIFEEASNYKDFFFLFYDAGTLVERLILISRGYSKINMPDMQSRALRIAEEIVEEDCVLKNGIPISNVIKSTLYNEMGVNAAEPINEVKYYEKALEYDPEDLFVKENLAAIYSYIGEYEKSDSLLFQSLDSLNKYNDEKVRKRKMFIYRTLGENAIARDDKTGVKEYFGHYLSATIRDYLNASQTMTSYGRQCYWGHYSTTLPLISSIDYNGGIDASNSYNAALFQKSILIRQQRAIKDNISRTDDVALKNAFERYNQEVRTETDSTVYSRSEAEYMYLYSLHPEFVQSFKIPKWQDIRERLKKNELAIEFSVAADTLTREAYYMAILLGKTYDSPKIIRLCKQSELDSLFNKNVKRGGFSLSLYKDKTLLYNYIWKPIEKELKGIRTIYYAPCHLLNNINVEIAQKSQRAQSIGEQYRLYRLMTTASLTDEHIDSFMDATLWGDIDYNASIFDSSASIDSSESNDIYANVRGNMSGSWKELQGMKAEILEVDSRLTAGRISSSVHSRNLATESAIKSLSGNSSNIIHIATHGYYYKSDEVPPSDFFEKNKEMKIDSQGHRAGLIFAGGNHAWAGESVPRDVDDGILTSDEILGLDFSQTKLLVLSACQTALGDIKSDGIYGLQSSFKIAGVETIVMSLWEVDDSATFTMMSKFYELLSKGKERHLAFREAQAYTKSWAEKQIKYGELSSYPPEYYWAAFVMLD